MFYFCIATLLLLLAIYHINGKKPLSRIEVIILGTVFALIAGLSYETGVDWKQYGIAYDFVNSPSEFIKSKSFFKINGFIVETGFAALECICKSLSDDFQIVMFIANIICAIFIFKHLECYTSHFYLFILLYLGYIYLALNMSGIRQAIAISIFIYAVKYIGDGYLKKYLFFCMLAASFHISALITIPVYWLGKVKFHNYFLWPLIIMGLIICALRISMINSFISQLLSISNNPFIGKIVHYTLNSEETRYSISSLKIILYIALLAILWKNQIKLYQQNNYNRIWLNIYILFIIMLEFLWDTGEIIERLRYYFNTSLFVLLPNLCFLYNKKLNRYICAVFIYLLSLWSSNPIFFELKGGRSYNPYQNYLVYKYMDFKSDGEKRLYEFSKR